MVGLFYHVCMYRGVSLVVCYLLCIWLGHLVYVVSCVCLVWGVVVPRIDGLGVCLGPDL